jgi:hypothetical protein
MTSVLMPFVLPSESPPEEIPLESVVVDLLTVRLHLLCAFYFFVNALPRCLHSRRPQSDSEPAHSTRE